MPIVEPEILLDGDHSIDRTLEVAERVWSEVFYYLAENNVVFEGILLKPSMVTPGAEHKEKASPETVAKYTLTMLNRRVPPAVPGIMVMKTITRSTTHHVTFAFGQKKISLTHFHFFPFLVANLVFIWRAV